MSVRSRLIDALTALVWSVLTGDFFIWMLAIGVLGFGIYVAAIVGGTL